MDTEKSFKITSVCKDDLREAFENDKEISGKIDSLTNGEMEYLARKMSDDYCNQLFWSSLDHITRRIIEDKEGESE